MSMKISSDLDINFSLQLLQNCQTVWNPAPGAVEKKIKSSFLPPKFTGYE